MIRNIRPMLQAMREHGVLGNLSNGMDNAERLGALRYLVRLYGIENVDLTATDPTTLANSIRLNASQKGNSFFARGREQGLFDKEGQIRTIGLNERMQKMKYMT